MARLPTLDDLGARPSPTPQSSVVSVQPGAVDTALAGVGDAITQIGQHLTEARRSSQLADALGQATEELGSKEIEFQRDQDFKTAPDRFKQAAQQIGAKAAGGIDDPIARQLFHEKFVALAAAKQLGVVKAAADQEGDYNRAQLSDHLDTFAIAAANASTPLERRVLLDQARTAIGEMRGGGGRPGWITDVQAKGLEDKFQINFFDAWRVKDPVAALNEFVTNRDKMRPDLAMRLEQHLFLAAAPVLAAQLNQGGGAGIVKPEEAPAGAPVTGGILARGVRNNNPGNIMRGAVQWEGEVAGNDPRYSAFETPEAGIRAMSKNLVAYQDQHGLDTVAGIVSRWAPATENDTASYVKPWRRTSAWRPTGGSTCTTRRRWVRSRAPSSRWRTAASRTATSRSPASLRRWAGSCLRRRRLRRRARRSAIPPSRPATRSSMRCRPTRSCTCCSSRAPRRSRIKPRRARS
jgi:hypothetical protein